ncbi:Helicase conserved C-terminal domain-containing protein [Fibrobacter sp. UWH9]|uniref:SNF2-related protein n=1 Tax=Fibrobacter sp. UWH9 TaxID=1896213 RepID=UPI000923BA08|nr:SNF2-related protein [Fibrobacter sp. UWH9]SHH70751.1 Helicase conserved C-terminal domain-containing protein [Fibrobacter sp. UWH9]
MDWKRVRKNLCDVIREMSANDEGKPVYGQDAAAMAVMDRLPQNGVILADDVGLGKTRVALMLMESVSRAGGTVAVISPSNLMHQWTDEAKSFLDTLANQSLKPQPVSLQSIAKLNKEHDYPLCYNDGSVNRWTIVSQQFGLVGNKNIKSGGDRNNEAAQKQKAFFRTTIKGLIKRGIISDEYSNEINHLIGALIGKVDLLVVDEAHKSRHLEDADEESKSMPRLQYLLSNIIQRTKDSRCLCMTATPVEMGVDQWHALLERCDQNRSDKTDVLNHIQNFSEALKMANASPENIQTVEKLIRSAETLHKDLKAYVVRRRRTNQQEYKDLISQLPDKTGSHPHRKIGSIGVKTDNLKGDWKSIIMCMEGISCAAKKSDASYRDKLLRCHYAAGMLNMKQGEALNDLNQAIKKERKQNAAKACRLDYWKDKLARYQESELFLLEHPRIQTTADHIESICSAGEKVLVFGTFIEPMKALRDELNYRHVLQRMEDGLPVALTRMSVDALWNVYDRLKVSKAWKRWGNKKSFRERFKEERDRFSVATTWLKDYVFGASVWFDMLYEHPTYSQKPYNEFLRKLESLSDEKRKAIAEKLRWDLLESIYQSSHKFSFSGKPSRRERSNLTALLINVIEVYLNCGKDDGLPINMKVFSVTDFIKTLMYDDTTGRHDSFCSMMSGKDDMDTRRPLLTKRFNLQNTFPQVLIAQSRVGREGLNLHRACSHVVIFNTEWNPAVVEQEIGRVDRIRSLWNDRMDAWNADNPSTRKDAPKIKVDFVVFDETYDQYQYEVFSHRRRELSSQLFGTLLDEETLKRVPKEYRDQNEDKLISAFDFDPVTRR